MYLHIYLATQVNVFHTFIRHVLPFLYKCPLFSVRVTNFFLIIFKNFLCIKDIDHGSIISVANILPQYVYFYILFVTSSDPQRFCCNVLYSNLSVSLISSIVCCLESSIPSRNQVSILPLFFRACLELYYYFFFCIYFFSLPGLYFAL